MPSAAKPKLAIVTESLRSDNHAPLRFFQNITVTHFYWNAPYGHMHSDELAGAVKYRNPLDLYRKLVAFKPDLIQGSEPYASRRSLLLSFVTAWAARRLKVPYVFPTLENLPPRERFGGVIGTLVERYFSWYTRHARAIIALNNGAAANLRVARVPDSKIVRFLWGVWGVDRTIFKPTRKVPHAVFEKPTILFVGRLDPEKGIRDVLDAFADLAGQHPDWQLVFLGRGMLEEEIRVFARANRLTERIHLFGIIANRDLPAYYSAAKATVYPSVATRRGEEAGIQGWSEQVGTVILQSLACGTPVVATRSGAIPEYLLEGGILVPEHDPEALARSIAQVMTDDGLHARLEREGLRYIAERFDAQKNVERAEELVALWTKLKGHDR